MRKLLLSILIFLNAGLFVRAQVIGELLEDESVLYAETKQVNQFFNKMVAEILF